MDLRVVTIPAGTMDLPSFVLISLEDAEQMSTQNLLIEGVVYRFFATKNLRKGEIALRATQRRMVNREVGQFARVENYFVSKSDKVFSKLHVQFMWSVKSDKVISLTQLANTFRNRFESHILMDNQKVDLVIGDNKFICTVHGEYRGVVSMSTEIISSWA